ncbi:MAG: hypothetical protein ACM3JP_01720 [Betaproteobacteria bacterium]
MRRRTAGGGRPAPSANPDFGGLEAGKQANQAAISQTGPASPGRVITERASLTLITHLTAVPDDRDFAQLLSFATERAAIKLEQRLVEQHPLAVGPASPADADQPPSPGPIRIHSGERTSAFLIG